VPQNIVPPQPSGWLPQVQPCAAQVVGAQQVFVERQTCPAAQVPQLSVPPQPSEALPQLKPRTAHVFGVQAPGLMVRFALADALLQGADAATVTKS